MKEIIKQEKLTVQYSNIILAADGSSVLSRKNTLVKNFANGDTLVKDYDFIFTREDESSQTVVTVRLNEPATQRLYEELGQKLKQAKADK